MIKSELVGWRGLYSDIIQAGWFNTGEKTALECVFYSDFEDCLFAWIVNSLS